MTDQTTASEPTVADVRRALVNEAADFHQRRQSHRHAMKIDGYSDVALDAYEGLAAAGCYGQVLAAILRDLGERGLEFRAAEYAAWVHDVMENGDDGLENANSDIPWGDVTPEVQAREDATDLALVQVRAATDNGNRTPLADVRAEFGMTEADVEAKD